MLELLNGQFIYRIKDNVLDPYYFLVESLPAKSDQFVFVFSIAFSYAFSILFRRVPPLIRPLDLSIAVIAVPPAPTPSLIEPSENALNPYFLESTKCRFEA